MVLNFLAETFLLGVKNIRLHKLRSLLTTLGIIFGVGAVILMVAIGEGNKQAALEQLAQLGARNIVIRSVVPPESNDPAARAARILDFGLRRLDLRNLKNTFGFPDPHDPDVHVTTPVERSPLEAIVPLRDTQQRVVVGERRISANAIGTVPAAFRVINLHCERGRVFNEVDHQSRSAVCVLGALAAAQMFPYEEPLGRWITVGSADTRILQLQVIGVLEKTGLRPGSGFISHDLDTDIFFPLTLAHETFGDMVIRRLAGSQERKNIELTEIWLQVRRQEEVEDLALVVNNVLGLQRRGPVDYEVKVPLEILRNAERLNRMFNFIMGGVASISLLVGGIGIMNIMLASVTERTREIGIRRALGARRKHIILQFLIETTLVSLVGGIIGIGLGAATSVALPTVVHYFSTQDYPTRIALWSVISAFVFSAAIGVFFGLYPAIRASQMDPIEALRHE